MNVGPAVSNRLALQRFFARTDFVTSKTSISRRSRPGLAAPFKRSRPDRLVFMLFTLSTSQAAKRCAHGNNISLASKCSGCGRPLGQVFSLTSWLISVTAVMRNPLTRPSRRECEQPICQNEIRPSR
jgi:hypothetical protein